MTVSVNPMDPGELQRVRILPDAGFGVLRTDRGNLPLDRLEVRAKISGLVGRTVVLTEFVNTHPVPLEATYVFPLPDRAAVTGMTMTADDRTVEAELQERGAAREAYDKAIAAGQRASIAEEDRPDVFTMRVGNILPAERVVIELSLVGPLPFEDGAATFRFPLVVAPRYIPGAPVGGPQAGDGQHLDTDAVPDASRISPPVLLPGFPNPLRLSVSVDIDPAGLTLGDVRSSLHAVSDLNGTISIRPGERADRDFVLRLAYAGAGESVIAVPDTTPGARGKPLTPDTAGIQSSATTPDTTNTPSNATTNAPSNATASDTANTPGNAVTPDIAGTPSNATTPDTAGTPSNATTPDTAGTPSNATTPDTAGTPSNATTPDTAGTPSNATTPDTAGTPSNATTPHTGGRDTREAAVTDTRGGETSGAVVSGTAADGDEGVYQLVVLPPDDGAAPKPKDVVLLLDRSGSMGGWKMVAARRAAARVVDTLTGADRFAVLTFDHRVDRPADLGSGLSEASDRNRFRAVEHLSQAEARGGTELLTPLVEGLELLRASEGRDRVLVLVTDGQVGNEDQIIQEIAPLIGPTRIHTIGIDRAVNAGFLGRLAALGAGRAELVESEDRLDAAMEHIHRRIGSPVVADLRVTASDLRLIDDERSPARLPGIYPGVPLVITGRYAGKAAGTLTVTGRTRDDREFRTTIAVQERAEPAITAQWARARLRDLEDAYAAGDHTLEPRIVATSLRFGVLCRFTAFVAVDSRVVNEGGQTRRVTQPVELPAGWAAPGTAADGIFLASASASSPIMPPPMASQPPVPARFAPARARAAGASPASVPLGFVGGNAVMRASKLAGGGSAPVSLTEARDLAATEARRLRDAAGTAGYERREFLEDLASRLAVLLTGTTEPEFAALRDLVTVLDGNGSLDDKWRAAVETLTAFAAAAPKGPGDSGQQQPSTGEQARKAFWKR